MIPMLPKIWWTMSKRDLKFCWDPGNQKSDQNLRGVWRRNLLKWWRCVHTRPSAWRRSELRDIQEVIELLSSFRDIMRHNFETMDVSKIQERWCVYIELHYLIFNLTVLVCHWQVLRWRTVAFPRTMGKTIRRLLWRRAEEVRSISGNSFDTKSTSHV